MMKEKTKKIIYPRFQSWLTKQLKKPTFRAGYSEEKALIELAFSLEEARKQRHLTQEKLANTIGMKTEAISRIESGTHNMTVETLVKVAEALGKRIQLV